MQINIGGMQDLLLCATYFILDKPGLHIVVTTAKHACVRVLKRVLMLSTYRLQIFPVKYEFQGIRGKLKKPVRKHVLAILNDLYGDQVLSSSFVIEMSNKEDFKDFEAMIKKQTFHPVNLSLSRVIIKLIKCLFAIRS